MRVIASTICVIPVDMRVWVCVMVHRVLGHSVSWYTDFMASTLVCSPACMCVCVCVCGGGGVVMVNFADGGRHYGCSYVAFAQYHTCRVGKVGNKSVSLTIGNKSVLFFCEMTKPVKTKEILNMNVWRRTNDTAYSAEFTMSAGYALLYGEIRSLKKDFFYQQV